MAGEGGGSTTDLKGEPGDHTDEAPAQSPNDEVSVDTITGPDEVVTPSKPEPEPIAGTTPSAVPVPPPFELTAAEKSMAPLPRHRQSLERRLFEDSFNFDFFQAVRLLQRMDPQRVKVGRSGPARAEAVRFCARISLSFPPSSIYELRRPTTGTPIPIMVQAFMGLTGPSGVLPRIYTEKLYKIEREVRTPEKHALRDWFDLFNHRLVSLFYRAWEKYRFYVPFERGEYGGPEPDPFTACLYSLIGLGSKPLRGRLRVIARESVDQDGEIEKRVLAKIEDLVLLHFSGVLGHRPRCAVALESMVGHQFDVPARVDQFQGQWLELETSSRTRLDADDGNNKLGVSAVAGDRVWSRQSKFRIRLGPLNYHQFVEFLPDRNPVRERKAFFLLVHLVRLYAEPSLDFDVQLVLKAEDVPDCQLTGDGGLGARLGWNTWLQTHSPSVDAEDVVLDGVEVVFIDGHAGFYTSRGPV
jgi:type VI secretion system protein ImpH